MGASGSRGGNSSAEKEMAQKFVDGTVGGNAVVMFSKTWCPYCNMAKEALKEAGLSVYTLIELDDREDGPAIQDYLLQLTGARSVPRVFINHKFIGGGGDIKQLQREGKLVGLLKEAGAL